MLSMSTRAFISQLWVAGMLLQAVLAGVLVAKKAWKKFPVFTAYSAFSLATGLGLYSLRTMKPLYMKVFWFAEIVGLLLGFAVIYEIFSVLLKSYPALRTLARSAFQWAALALVLLGCIVLYSQPSADRNPIMSSMLVVEEATRTIEVGLLLFLFLFASAFGLHWRQYVFGVALGFGVFISVELIAITMRLYLGFTPGAFSLARMLAFDVSLLMWLGYLLAPESKTQRMDVPKLSQLEQWNQALMELIHQ